ncbi:hypothetical protein JK202_16000 [Gluconobacter sp. Dm-62]|nr:hypothetical protein [Gluconobacter sp. Dm-62]
MADFQPFLLVKAEQLLVIETEAFPRQKLAQAAVSKAASLGRQILQALAKGSIVRRGGNMPHNTSGNTDKRTGAAFTQGQSLLYVSDRLPFRDRRDHFFSTISFRAALSSMASASRRFRRLFSSSSAFRAFSALNESLGIPKVAVI